MRTRLLLATAAAMFAATPASAAVSFFPGSGGPLPGGSEDPYVRSTIVAPSGLMATREEKRAIREHELATAGSREST